MSARFFFWVFVLAVATGRSLAAQTAVPHPFVDPGCTRTLLGTPVAAPRFDPATLKRLETDLAVANAALGLAPDREHSHIWVGRRLGYLGRQCEAIDAFSRGLERFPTSYRLRRFRGQALNRVRRPDLAIQDFTEGIRLAEGLADAFESDGAPNAMNLTLSTDKSNLHYYLGHAQFAAGDFAAVVASMTRAQELLPHFVADETRPATVFWRYVALRKLGRATEARQILDLLPPGRIYIENNQYAEAVRLFQGQIPESQAAANRDRLVRFAVALFHRFNGDEAGAAERLRALTADGPSWEVEVELVAPTRNAR